MLIGRAGRWHFDPIPARVAQEVPCVFTAEFRASHPQLLNLFKKEARLLGEGCGTVELDTEANALALGPEKAMVVKSRVDFSNLVRKLATVARERGERGTFRK